MIDMQPCGVAKLMSAVFNVPLEEGYAATGLLCCSVCGQASTNDYYPYCGLRHQRKGEGLGPAGCVYIDMVCDICRLEFRRPVSQITSNARKRDKKDQSGEYKVFCSNKCNGVWFGEKHGVVPRGIAGNPNRLILTHCRRGHEFTEANTYRWKKQRSCRTCNARRAHEVYKKQKGAKPNV